MNDGSRKQGKASRLEKIGSNSHEKRIIEECMKKFRNGRANRIGSFRQIKHSQLENIASELLSEVSVGDNLFPSTHSLESNKESQDSNRPTPLIDETDEMLQFTRSNEYKILIHHILEALETEIAEMKENDNNSNSNNYYYTENFIDNNEDSNMESFMDGDISIEEYDCEEVLICPLCQLKPMEIDTELGIGRCDCLLNCEIHFKSFGEVQDFKLILASIFERHFSSCSQRYKSEKLIGVNDPRSFTENLKFSFQSQNFVAYCEKCGFYEVVY